MLLPLIAIGGSLTACGAGVADAPLNDTPEAHVAFLADKLSYVLPQPTGDGMLTAVSAEGQDLVLQIEIDFGGTIKTNPTEMTKVFRSTICNNEGYRGVINSGGRVALDISDPVSMQRLPRARIAYCT